MTSTAIIKHFESYDDGSGVACLIVCDGFTFACNFLGGARITNITNTSYRKPTSRTLALVAHRFARQIDGLGAEWMEKNAAMYSA